MICRSNCNQAILVCFRLPSDNVQLMFQSYHSRIPADRTWTLDNLIPIIERAFRMPLPTQNRRFANQIWKGVMYLCLSIISKRVVISKSKHWRKCWNTCLNDQPSKLLRSEFHASDSFVVNRQNGLDTSVSLLWTCRKSVSMSDALYSKLSKKILFWQKNGGPAAWIF